VKRLELLRHSLLETLEVLLGLLAALSVYKQLLKIMRIKLANVYSAINLLALLEAF
jgi:Fe2+ or Zn2+ uptake regulation protein